MAGGHPKHGAFGAAFGVSPTAPFGAVFGVSPYRYQAGDKGILKLNSNEQPRVGAT